ncbi:hypothetical protein R3P38DRAFT_3498159 [Favolaschia claudopus]|uniref:Uncharacterized protein n=1 Tax=Favolaschia claudopus TaxID=2862362 RepID=A0AAW0C566_9AGAR
MEEMRRVLQFLEWKAGWWTGLVGQREAVVSDAVLNEGFTAYARRQSRTQLDLRARFQANWRDVPAYIQMGRDSVSAIPEEEEDGGEDEEDENDDAPVPEAPRDDYLGASLVDESLA